MSPKVLPCALALLASACLSGRPPWLGDDYAIVSGGRIWTEVGAPPVEALLIEDGEVLAVGTTAEIEARAAEIVQHARDFQIEVAPRRIELAGAVAVPGLVDAHGHLEGLGASLESVDLSGCRSLDELVERVAARAAQQPGVGWLTGRGWDQTLFPGQEFPRHAALSARLPDRPVFLERVDGHAAFVNAKALELAGLTGALPAVEGGRIVVDEDGRPTGVLVDAATALVEQRIPPPDRATRARRILAAQEALLAFGLVGMHDMGTGPETLSVLRELEDEGSLKLRVASYLWANEGLAPFGRVRVMDDPADSSNTAKLRVVGAKLMVDGALGSRGAALLEPYADAPGERGLLQMTPEVYAARLAEVLAAGLQPATHAIGDAGNRMVLDAYAAAGRALAGLRPRVEHAQVVAEEDWHRFEALGVIPSMQPTHATSDMRWAEARLGSARVRGAYAWRRLAGPHAPLALGSDFPVESANPLLGLYAARTRTDASGHPAGGWQPDQCLDALAALAGFTSGAAYAAREEEHRGKLLPGYAADLTVLSVDPVDCEPRALLEARVLATIVDGELVYSAPANPTD